MTRGLLSAEQKYHFVQTRVSVARAERQVQVPELSLRRPGQMAALLVRLRLAASPDGGRTSEAGSLCPELDRRPSSSGSTVWPACRPGLPVLPPGLRLPPPVCVLRTRPGKKEPHGPTYALTFSLQPQEEKKNT